MSIKRHGQKTVKLESLNLPGDIRVRMKSEHVIALAESYKSTGGRPMNAPWVDRETGRIVAGRDRTAAMMAAGIKETVVEHVSGDPIDLARATIIGNFHRRLDDRQKLAKQLAELEEGRIEEDGIEPKRERTKPEPKPHSAIMAHSGPELPTESKSHAGRPQAARAKALEKVAEELHITPKAAKRLVQRAEAKEEAIKRLPTVEAVAAKAVAEVAPPPRPIKTFGVTVPLEILARAEKEQALIDKIAKLITEAKRTYTELESLRGVERFEGNKHIGSSFRTAINELNKLKLSRPASVCPYCKMVPDIVKTCAACRGHGYVDELGLKDVHPVYLREGDDAIVACGGKEMPLSKFSLDDF
jgi:ParB-like chromosome segregation protein Spo0J